MTLSSVLLFPAKNRLGVWFWYAVGFLALYEFGALLPLVIGAVLYMFTEWVADKIIGSGMNHEEITSLLIIPDSWRRIAIYWILVGPTFLVLSWLTVFCLPSN